MTYVITEPCVDVKDGACVDACPVDCIHGGDEDRQLFIDPEICIDCDLCATVCPVEAVYKEAEVPEEWEHYIALNSDYFADDNSPGTGSK